MSSEPRRVLVSGASRGIGRALVERLLGDGQRVVGLARSFSDADRRPGFDPHAVDLAELDALPALLSGLAARYPDTDAVICNAGVGRFGSLEEFSYPQIQQLMNLNFTAQAYLSRAFLPLLKRRDRSDLVFIGSEAALSGGRRGAVYSASKAALRGFAQALRDECSRSGVRVSVVNPGATRSEFFSELSFAPGDAPEHAILPDEVALAVTQILALRPGVVVDEINLSPLKKVWNFAKSS